MKPLFIQELIRNISVLLLSLAIGGVLGYWVWGLILGLCSLLGMHIYYAAALFYWQAAPRKRELPDGWGIWADINRAAYTRHKQARKRKKRLANILAEFRASTAASPDAAVVLRPDSSIVWFNQAATALLGLDSAADQGQRISNLLRHPDFVRYSESNEFDEHGVEVPSPQNPHQTLWLRIIPYGQSQSLLVARDVSEFKRVEMLRRDFVANASHELRTPLTVLRGYLDMMADDSDKAGELNAWQAPILEMRRQATRMQQIIGDLLKLSSLEIGQRQTGHETVDMPNLLSTAVDEARVMSDGEHDISAEIDGELCVIGQSEELQSVVSNLLSNALRYTPKGGMVKLTWERKTLGAELTVIDSGIGISEKDLPRLTERFYRADAARSRETGGTGLGLAIVKHALESHQAELRIESRPGRGSRFICRFPERKLVSLAA